MRLVGGQGRGWQPGTGTGVWPESTGSLQPHWDGVNLKGMVDGGTL